MELKPNLTFAATLHARVIKHGPVSRLTNKLRRTRLAELPKPIDVLQKMRF